jgi:FkbM family methyltransferase
VTEEQIISALDQAKTRRAEFTSLRSTGIIDRAYAIENCKHFSEQPHFVTVPLFNGALFQIDLREFVSQEIYLYGSFEEDLTAFFVKYLKPGMVFVDVGAHFGYYSVVASSLVGATGRVVAFEPVSTTFKRLQANTRNCTNVDVRQIAVWNKSGQLVGNAWSAWNSVTAPRSEPGEMAKVRSENVAAITLEEAFPVSEPQPSVVKIDVESAEMEVLEGMSRLLREVDRGRRQASLERCGRGNKHYPVAEHFRIWISPSRKHSRRAQPAHH